MNEGTGNLLAAHFFSDGLATRAKVSIDQVSRIRIQVQSIKGGILDQVRNPSLDYIIWMGRRRLLTETDLNGASLDAMDKMLATINRKLEP